MYIFGTRFLESGVYLTYGTSQFRPATFQVLESHMWLVAAALALLWHKAGLIINIIYP